MFSGLELLATAVVALDERFIVRYANPAAESLLATGAKSLIGQPFDLDGNGLQHLDNIHNHLKGLR